MQLKSELDLLLNFNENLLHFDSSIVKKAAKTKVESFMKTLSSAIDTQTKGSKEGLCKGSKSENLEAASNILNVTEEISRTLASTLDVGTKTEIKLANISMTVMKKQLSENTSSEWEAGAVKVKLPDQSNIAQDSSVTVSFTSYNNLGSMMNLDNAFTSSVLSVNVIKNKNHNRSIPLKKPIEFILHHKPFTASRKRKCVYWDFQSSTWSHDGCYTIKNSSTASSTACQCFHLTNFALTVEQEEPPATEENIPEATTVASKVSWDISAYYSADPSVTPGPEYLEKTVEKKVDEVKYTTKPFSSEATVFIVSAPPRILKTEDLVLKEHGDQKRSDKNDENLEDFGDILNVFNEFVEFPEFKSDISDKHFTKTGIADYENFWENTGLDDSLKFVTTDNINSNILEDIESKDDVYYPEAFEKFDIETFSPVAKREKSQPLMILKNDEQIIPNTKALDTTVKQSKADEQFQRILSTAGIAGGSVVILCFLSVLCLCICWSQHRRKVGKHSLVGGCSIYSGFDGSVGTVSSVGSLYSQDLSGSYDFISADNFLSSLEDE